MTKRYPPLPSYFPTDKLYRINEINGITLLVHPQREPHQLNTETNKWEKLEKVK